MNNSPKRKKWVPYFVVPLIIVIFISSHQNFLFAKTSPSEYKLNKEFLGNFRDDFVDVFVSPRDWKKRDILNLSAVLGAGAIFFALDQEFHKWFQNHRNSTTEDISKIISPLGYGACLASLMTIMYASGEFSDNNDLRKTALLSLESWVISGVLVSTLKFLTGRARPQTGESSFSFHPFSFRSNFLSFPSGHASSAFAVASTIADQSDETYIDLLAYSLATLVAVSRVHDSKHWASDVFIGSAIGYFAAKKISALNRRRNSGKFKVNFQFSQQRQAIVFSYCF